MDEKISDFDAEARVSLLDVVLDRLTKLNKTTIVSRLIYVARFTRRESNSDYQKAFVSKILEGQHQQDSEITGILIVYPFCCVHVIEGKISSIMGIIREVSAASEGDSKIAEARVISSTEDVPARCFSGWRVGVVGSGSSVESMEPLDGSSMVKAATDINTCVRKVGASLVGISEPEARKRMAMMDSFYDDLPAPELVLSLTPAEDAPTLMEYLHIFDAPINVDLDSEKVWPIPAQLKY